MISERNTNQLGFNCPNCGKVISCYIPANDVAREKKILEMRQRLHSKKCVPRDDVDIDAINAEVTKRMEARRKIDKAVAPKSTHIVGNPGNNLFD